MKGRLVLLFIGLYCYPTLTKDENMKKITCRIGGMHCAACSTSLERVLNKNKAIKEARVNLATEEASIEYNEKDIDLEGLKKIVEKAGFKLLGEKEKESFEDRTLQARVITAIVFNIILLYVAMGPMIGLPLPFSTMTRSYGIIQMALVIPVLLCGYPFFIRGFKNLFRLHPNMDTLVALGCTASFLFSIYGLATADASHMHHVLYFEGAGTIATLVMVGKMLEERSKKKSAKAIEELVALQPSQATRIKEDGSYEVITIKDIQIKDRLLVRPGEKLPIDGVIIKGHASIDEAMLTGESVPADKTVGDKVFAATINSNTSFEMEASVTGLDTALHHIIEIVREAQSTKAPIARVADTVSLYFVPVVIAISIITFALWMLSGKGISIALTNAVAVLVIACPCALGLATPIAIMVSTGKAAKLGILFREAGAVEKLRKADTFIFDKTGTLTNGKLKLTDTDLASEEIVLVASAEKKSEHPLGKAIVEHAEKEGFSLPECQEFEALPGRGFKALVDEKQLIVGNRTLMEEFSISYKENEERIKSLEADGKTLLLVAIDGTYTGYIALQDTLRDEALRCVSELKAQGKSVIMLTGDNERTAKAIAAKAGIESVYAGVLPERKREVVLEEKAKGHNVAMVGDGINDTPALASADIALSVGSASDVAISTSDIILMHNDLSATVTALKLSNATMKNIKENLFWAFFYNTLGIPVAAGVLTLFGGPSLNPMLAALAMSISSLSVVTNALRLGRFKG